MLYSLSNLKYDITSLLTLNVDAIDEKTLQDLNKMLPLNLVNK